MSSLESGIKGITNNYNTLNSFLQSRLDSVFALDACFIQISSFKNTAAIKTDGTLWTWGSAASGTLGDGTTVNRCSPGTVAGGGTTWCQVSFGTNSSAAIKTDGTLWTWGFNNFGILGTGTTVNRCSPGTIAGGGTTWCQVSNGINNSAAIKTDGTLWTWGSNLQGSLGDGTTVSRCSPGTIAGGGTTWNKVFAGCWGFAAIKTDGTLWTWGFNNSGRLGDGTTVDRCSPGTIAGGGTTWCSATVAFSSGLAIKTDGTLWSWGFNSSGQLGTGTTVTRCSPGTIAGGGSTWCSVSNIGFSPIAVKTDGTLWTWGCNNFGVLGDGTTVNRCSPGTIAGEGTTWCQVSSDYCSAGAIKYDGTLWTWGCNSSGQLGDKTTVSRCSPGSILFPTTTSQEFLLLASAVDQISEHRQLSVPSSDALPCIFDTKVQDGQMIFVESINAPVVANNECWIGLDGRVYRYDCAFRNLFTWGNNPGGQLGDGTTINRCSPATVAGGGTTWCQVSGGLCHTAAIKTDGTLWTWGCNGTGRLGDGNLLAKCSPGTTWGSYTTWCQVSSGCAHTAAIKTDGTLWTWGSNISGRLGNGTTTSRISPATVAGGGTTWCQVSSGFYNTASIKTDGTLWTWGNNNCGVLGDGTTVSRCSPGTIAGEGTNWCQVFGGRCHIAAIKTDGTIWTWGSNFSGQLGDGTTVSRCSPGTIAGEGTNWCQVSSGGLHTAATKTDGTLWTWGANNQGQLGNGTATSRCSPSTIAGGGTTWCRVSGGNCHTAAIKTDGTLWTWGYNGQGRLGDGTTVNRCSPGTIAGGGTTWCQVSSGIIAITNC